MNRIRFDSHQRPVIRDTGILLDGLLELIAAGKTEFEIIQDHPCLERADFEEAYRYGSLLMCVTGLAERLKEIRSTHGHALRRTAGDILEGDSHKGRALSTAVSAADS
ncbi:MAG: DUF433 domain-containing protein [Bryobacterales bacterium]|nr:DUF433 domain-containing protein [Bryobacterales bacterium]